MHIRPSFFSVQKIASALLALSMLLLPIIIIPVTEQFIFDSKRMVFFALVLSFGFLYIVKTLQSKIITFKLTPLTGAVALLGVAVLASSFASVSYPFEHLLGFGGVYLGLALLVLLGSSVINPEEKVNPVIMLGIGNALLTVASVLEFFGVGASHLFNRFLPVPLPNNLIFNLSGSSLIAIQLLVVGLVGYIGLFLAGRKFSIIEKLAGIVMLVGVLIHGYSLLPGQIAAPALMPYTASWSIAIDSLKSPKTALLGFGPEGFIDAYNQLKPQWMNGSPLWNVQFSQGSSVPFSMLITTGAVGLVGWLLLVIIFIRQTKLVRPETRPIHWMLLSSFLINFFLPPTIIMVAIQAILILFWITSEAERFSDLEIYGLTMRVVKRQNLTHPLTNNAKLILYSFNLILLVLFVGLTYGVGRAYAASVKLFESIYATQKNDAVAVYNLQQAAVRLNPYAPAARRRYGLTNLAIAAALSQKTDRTAEETQQFTQLVQQAIREGKAATVLNPADTNNWRILAQIYRSLVGAAAGADQWAVTAYVKAIETAPTDANLRIQLGGILYAQKAYEDAARFFQQAISLKPDLANGYYNLANTFVQLGKLAEARVAYQQTLQLLQPDSDNYIRASEELRQVEQKLSETNAAQPPKQTGVPTPSITNQNANESPNDTVANPGQQELNLNNQGGATGSSAPNITLPKSDL